MKRYAIYGADHSERCLAHIRIGIMKKMFALGLGAISNMVLKKTSLV